MTNNQEFSRMRKIFFPVHSHELRKVLPLFFLFLFITACYGILRSIKDIFFMTYTGKAEGLYFLKTYVVTPFMILLTVAYASLSKYHRDTRFFVTVGYFLLVIFACYFVFVPNIDTFRLDKLADNLTTWMPSMADLWDVLRYWPLSLVYLNGEAWGSMGIGVLFWTLANEITSMEQAKRVYSYLAMGAALGSILAGVLLKKVINENSNIGLLIVVIIMSIILVSYYLFSRDIKKNPELYQVEVAAPGKKKKVVMTLGESFKFLAKSQHLALIATLVFCYGSFIALFEASWKSELSKLAKISGGGVLSQVYGDQAIGVGVLAILFSFISGWFVKKGWKFTASTTPVVGLLATIFFFAFLFKHLLFAAFCAYK